MIRVLFWVLALAVGCESSASPDGGVNPMPDGSIDAGPDAGTGASSGAGGFGGVGGGTGAAGGGGAPAAGSVVFVTSIVQNANLGGISGADAICATEATEAGLDGEFRAWLSLLDSPVADRLVQSDAPYVLVDGTRIADDWADLTDGFIQAPINLDAMGRRQSGDVWTATLPGGQPYTVDDCAGFTSGDPGSMSLCGSSASTFGDWTATFTPACSTRLRLYCFQQ